MPKIRHILFPLDLSAAGMAAIPYVRALSNQLNARVTVLSVVPPAWVSPPGIIPPPPGVDPVELQNTLQAQLDNVPMSGLLATRVTALGDPAETIAEFVRNNGIDLVAIPTHGHGVFRRLLIGSVTSKVLHDVYCPVWTAAHAEKQHANDVPRRILCALDGGEGSVALAKWAAGFSQQAGGTLQFMHVVRKVSDWLSFESEQELQEQVQKESRSRLELALSRAGLDLPLRVVVGDIVNTIAEEARQEKADLIVLGRGAMHETLGSWRTHVHGIIQHSPCPVLSV